MAPDRRRRRPLALLALVAALVTAALGAGAAAQGSGLPVPRFASLGGSALNVRTGPDRQYPVRWIYERPGYPVLVVEEHDVWRRIEDAAGEGGWIHGSLLSGRRNLLVTDGPAELYRTPNADARVVAVLDQGVIGRMRECGAGWCLIEVEGRRGWIERRRVWGVLPGEVTARAE